MSTIKISELATSTISLTDFFAKADESGVANKNTVQELSNLLKTVDDTAFKGSIAIADVPSENGWYFASESGTYTNCGGLVIDTSDNIAIIIVSGTFDVFNKIDIPVNITIDATVIDGSLNAVSGNGVFDELALKANLSDIVSVKEDLSLNFKNLSNGAIPSSITGASWSVLNGEVINTPSETVFPINDGSLELWTDANNLTDWDKLIPTGGSLDRVTDSIDGTYSAKITVNSSGGRTEIKQSVSTIPLGSFYNVRAFAKCDIDGVSLRINNDNQLNNISQTPLSSTVFTEMLASSYRKTTSGDLLIQNYGNADKQFTIDKISVATVLSASVLSLTENLGNLKRVKTYVTPALGSFAGLVMNVDDIANPQNYIALVKYGGDSNIVFIWKMVDGVLSQVHFLTIDAYDNKGLYELKQVTDILVV